MVDVGFPTVHDIETQGKEIAVERNVTVTVPAGDDTAADLALAKRESRTASAVMRGRRQDSGQPFCSAKWRAAMWLLLSSVP